MARTIQEDISIHCPVCGEKLKVPINVESVQLYSNSAVLVHFYRSDVKHTCKEQPDTDGLNPIERFVEHGALDDQGRKQ